MLVECLEKLDKMPSESEYGDDIRMLDDLTRLKLRLIDRVCKYEYFLCTS